MGVRGSEGGGILERFFTLLYRIDIGSSGVCRRNRFDSG